MADRSYNLDCMVEVLIGNGGVSLGYKLVNGLTPRKGKVVYYPEALRALWNQAKGGDNKVRERWFNKRAGYSIVLQLYVQKGGHYLRLISCGWGVRAVTMCCATLIMEGEASGETRDEFIVQREVVAFEKSHELIYVNGGGQACWSPVVCLFEWLKVKDWGILWPLHRPQKCLKGQS